MVDSKVNVYEFTKVSRTKTSNIESNKESKITLK